MSPPPNTGGADRSQRPNPERKPELNKPGLRVGRRPHVRLLVRQLRAKPLGDESEGFC